MFSIPKNNNNNKNIEETKTKMKEEVTKAAEEVDREVAKVTGDGGNGTEKEPEKKEAPKEVTQAEDSGAQGQKPVDGLEDAVGDILSGEKKISRVEFNEKVHVMPREFSKKAQKLASKTNFVVVIIFLVFIGLGVLAGGYYYLKAKTKEIKDANGNSSMVDTKMIEEENFSPEAVKSKVNLEELKEEQEQEEVEFSGDEKRNTRDTQRITDIQNLRAALSDYYFEFSEYPVLLDKLVESGNIKEIPKNPVPGGKTYAYKLAVDYQSYTLDYALEGQKGIYSEGEQRATQDTMSTRDNPEEIIKEALEESEPEEDKEQNKEVVATSSEDQILTKEEEQAEATTTEEVVEESLEPTSGTDTDKDGVSDKEEQLFGMNPSSNDTDGDGYSDKEELHSLNNPAGPGVINTSNSVNKYTNDSLGYELLYPSGWTYSSIGGNGSVMFKAADNQSVQILSPSNPGLLPIDEWYHTEVSARAIQDSQRISKNGWEGLYSPDGLTIYLGYPGGSEVYVISYSPGFNSSFDYMNVFTLMVNSFKESGASVSSASVIEEVATSSQAQKELSTTTKETSTSTSAE